MSSSWTCITQGNIPGNPASQSAFPSAVNSVNRLLLYSLHLPNKAVELRVPSMVNTFGRAIQCHRACLCLPGRSWSIKGGLVGIDWLVHFQRLVLVALIWFRLQEFAG